MLLKFCCQPLDPTIHLCLDQSYTIARFTLTLFDHKTYIFVKSLSHKTQWFISHTKWTVVYWLWEWIFKIIIQFYLKIAIYILHVVLSTSDPKFIKKMIMSPIFLTSKLYKKTNHLLDVKYSLQNFDYEVNHLYLTII